ncbi:MAG: CaiB/BaiF CoA-transferase family protein [Microthrixaceae bacterium]
MRLGELANEGATEYGRPLDGVRILAAEQMQALPFATQLLTRLGAEVVKVEHPRAGESGRASQPAMADPDGRPVGATFLRNNLNKRSVGIDLKHPRGRELFAELSGRFDVVAENFKAGTMARLGLGYDVLAERYPSLIYVSVSGFGNDGSPYAAWPAYAMVPEAMSGLYDYSRHGDEPPRVIPRALGDISTGLFAVIGVQAALRHRERTGLGQYVDVAMLDSMLAMGDIATNLWSLGERPRDGRSGVMDSFAASDGYFVMQLVREHQFEAWCTLVGRPEWVGDPRFATRRMWGEATETLIRPAVEAWAAGRTRVEVCAALGAAGIPAGPVFTPDEVIADRHVEMRHMLVEMDRTDGVDTPVLIPGNPVKMSRVAEGPETRVPWVGEHTDEVLRAELGLDDAALRSLRADAVI